MKKIYESPEMNVEAFVANDYVAACFTFAFKCNNDACLWGGWGSTKSADANSVSDAVAAINSSDNGYSEIIRPADGGGYMHRSTAYFQHNLELTQTVNDNNHPNASV